MLFRLIPHFPRTDLTQEQIASRFRDMTEDLAMYSLPEIDAAMRVFRTDPKNKYYPGSGALIGLMDAARRDKREMAKLKGEPGRTPFEFGDSRPHSWEYQRKRFWAKHWSVDDLNKARDPERRARYDAWLKRVKAGEVPGYNPSEY
jgi:hypothetical protein